MTMPNTSYVIISRSSPSAPTFEQVVLCLLELRKGEVLPQWDFALARGYDQI